MTTAPVYVALGSNVGERAAHLAFARERLSRLPQTRLLGVSTVEETAPLGGVVQGPYLNQMALLETALEPAALLGHLLAIEAARGRDRTATVRWGPRTLDLDIVRYGDRVIAEPNLTLPHRDFWQRELAELDVLVPHG